MTPTSLSPDAAAPPAEASLPAPPLDPDTRHGLGELIARMATGDEMALARFYELTLARVYGLACRIAGRSELAEEICVETFWQAWRDATRYNPARGEPLAWLMMMTRSRALDALRRLDPAQNCADPEQFLDGQCSPERSPLDTLLLAEQTRALGPALMRLTSTQRQMIGLAFYRDLSHQQISDETGLPLGTVKSHLKRAQDALRIALAQA